VRTTAAADTVGFIADGPKTSAATVRCRADPVFRCSCSLRCRSRSRSVQVKQTIAGRRRGAKPVIIAHGTARGRSQYNGDDGQVCEPDARDNDEDERKDLLSAHVQRPR